MTVKEYAEEFYKVSIKAGQIQDRAEKISRYINGIKTEIQDEISILSPKTVEEAYQMALKAEEKLIRKKYTKGRGNFRGRGSQGGRGISTAPRDGASSSSPQYAPTEGDTSGRRSSYRGRGGRNRGREVRCYRCNKLGHRAYECPENVGTNQRNEIISQTKEEARKFPETEKKIVLEKGEYLVVNKVLLKQIKEVVEPT